MNELDKIILGIVELEKGKPITKKALIFKVQKNYADHDVRDIFKSLRYLSNNFLISHNQLGKIKEGYKNGEVIDQSGGSGVIFINNIGDGFIKIEDSTDEYYVNKKNLHGGLSGDKVSFVLMDKQTKKNLNDAIVTEVIERNTLYFVGTISISRGIVYCNLDDHKVFQRIIIINPSQLVEGYKVWVRAIEFLPSTIKVEVVKVIGHKDDIGIDIESIVFSHGIEPAFDNDVIDYANNLSKTIDAQEKARRVDLTHLPIVTIDPSTSKDLDDAIYVIKELDQYRLYVSIADVSHYVKPNTILDEEARKRGTSIYLIDKVIPMLPHILSNDICSLNPEQETLTITCEMVVKLDGSFGEIKVYDSIINSQKRFSYDEVNTYFKDQTKLEGVSSQIYKMLDDSHDLYQILRSMLSKRGYIDFEIKEPKILLDDKGKVSDIVSYERGDAQMMIENFMIAANEATTLFYNQKFKDQAFVYRVHDKPNEAKLTYFQTEAKKINFVTKGDVHQIEPHTISNWISQNNFVEPKKTILNKLLLKTMVKAEYSTKNIGHFGLASKNYTHFTSPIRRYPDVLVHRIYKMQLTNPESYTNNDRQQLFDALEFDCQDASKKEVRAVEIEREVNSLKYAEFMASKIGETYEGIVTHITGNGVFVELTNLIEGMVRLSNIKINDFFNYNQEDNTLIGIKTKIKISFGCRVKIKVTNVNVQLKQIDFSLLEIINVF